MRNNTREEPEACFSLSVLCNMSLPTVKILHYSVQLAQVFLLERNRRDSMAIALFIVPALASTQFSRKTNESNIPSWLVNH